ncbi:mCG145972, partial [Mus musculus]
LTPEKERTGNKRRMLQTSRIWEHRQERKREKLNPCKYEGKTAQVKAGHGLCLWRVIALDSTTLLRKQGPRAEVAEQWQSICLSSMRPELQSPALPSLPLNEVQVSHISHEGHGSHERAKDVAQWQSTRLA